MARRKLIDKNALDPFSPNYNEIRIRIDNVEKAEEDFYNSRVAIQSQMGLNISAADLEKGYDRFLGLRPWDYLSIFNSAGNTRKDGDPAKDEIYVQLPDYLSDIADRTVDGGEFAGVSDIGLIRSHPSEVVPEMDIYYHRSPLYDSNQELADISDTQTLAYFTGFGERPIAYNNSFALTGFKAHMLRLIGEAYNDAVADVYSDYVEALEEYEDFAGTVGENEFSSGVGDTPWDGYTGDPSFGYNRYSSLDSKLILETRGGN